MPRYTAFLLMALVATPATAFGVTPVTSCGQMVEGVGILQADLDCTAFPGVAVTLANHSTLKLGGFMLTANSEGVHCFGTCRVLGPGTIARAFPSVIGTDSCIGVSGVFGTRVTVRDVAFSQFGWAINSQETARLARVTVTDGCFGVHTGRSVRIIDSTITDNLGYGAHTFGRMTVIGSTITGQLRDLWSPVPPRVRDSTCITSNDDTSPLGIDFWNVCS